MRAYACICVHRRVSCARAKAACSRSSPDPIELRPWSSLAASSLSSCCRTCNCSDGGACTLALGSQTEDSSSAVASQIADAWMK
eukprot:253001-Pleurochrysis_carterae.AAC.1